jgi:hypothetical protein
MACARSVVAISLIRCDRLDITDDIERTKGGVSFLTDELKLVELCRVPDLVWRRPDVSDSVRPSP